MKILVLGSGGREDAICWKLSQSALCTELYCLPGNPGTSRYAKNVDIRISEVENILAFAQNNKIDLTIVGPELPLTLGIVDIFENSGLNIFGPSKAAAQVEGSKSFTKDILSKANVATAAYEVVNTLEQAQTVLAEWDLPYVIKADGLAAGKGVVVCHKAEEAQVGLKFVFEELNADVVVLEQFLEGVEASFIVATNGLEVVPLATSHDYKRIFDNDQGPNTGGMGTVSPTPRLSTEQAQVAIEEVIRPFLAQLKAEGINFKGFLYAGLMIAPSGKISVVEFNARLGDPETQVIMRRLDSDIIPILARLAGHKDFSDAELELTWTQETAVCVVLASKDYPQSSGNGDLISGIEAAEEDPSVKVFHAGTKLDLSKSIVSNGGRVLNVTAVGENVEIARDKVYASIPKISFDGMQYRKDIGRT
jgi:phosphoribosylamine--glycine ligase